MLKVEKITAGYGSINVLWDVSFDVEKGEIISILGSNGAGKTTIARALSGLIKTRSGSIKFDGQELTGLSSKKILEAGIVQVPEGRQLFVEMTVMENLELGAFSKAAKAKMPETLELVFDYFPRLAERKKQLAGTLSGGEQQMVAVARGILSQPKLILLDEPSLGLAPNIVDQIIDVVKMLANERKVAVILVEQDVQRALRTSSRGFVIENGSVVLSDTAERLLVNEEVKKAYLGF